MQILKKILLAIVLLVVLLLVVALFVKKEYSVEREILIEKPKQEVFDYVKYLKNQDNFSKWAGIDPDMKKTYRGTDGSVGFVSAWESANNEVGMGEQEIKAMSEGERIDYELRFLKPFESTSPAYMITESAGDNQTIVKWGFAGKMKYPMNIMTLFMDFDQMIGEALDFGLNNLKDILESTETTVEENALLMPEDSTQGVIQ